jgi:hypothetical protein
MLPAFKKGRKKTGGRKRGTPNKISSMLISAEWRKAIFSHFKDHKQEALDLLLKEYPAEYAKIMAGFAAREQQLALENTEKKPDVPFTEIRRVIVTSAIRQADAAGALPGREITQTETVIVDHTPQQETPPPANDAPNKLVDLAPQEYSRVPQIEDLRELSRKKRFRMHIDYPDRGIV